MIDLGTIYTGGPINWDLFYQGMTPQATHDQTRLLKSDSPVADTMTFKGLQNLFGSGGDHPSFIDGLKPEIRDAVLGGETIGATGGASVGTMLEGIGGLIPRAAIIILGFVFVAAGLAMFKDAPLVKVVTGK